MKPLSEFRFGQSVPESFVFSRDGRYLYGSSYYTGVSNIFRYEVATGAIEAVSNAETGFFRPVPLADGRLLVLPTRPRASFRRRSRPRPLQGRRARSSSSAPRSPRSTRWSRPGRCRLPSTVDDDKEITGKGPYVPLRRPRARQLPSRFCRATRTTVGIGYHVNFADPVRSQHRHHRRLYAGQQPARRRAGHLDITGSTSAGGASCRGTGRTSTTCSGPPSAAARAMPPSSATTTC